MAEKMADRLAAARRREFVGRQDELAIFQAIVHDGDNGSVVFVHGPGGVGKSTMLRQFAWIGEQAGRIVVRIDGRETGPVPTTALAEIAAAAGCGGADDPLAELGGLKGLLVLVDTAEMLVPLDRWFREEFLPALSADTIAVFAGRSGPSLAWRTDPGWRGLLHSMRLENLSRAESQALLSLRGVPPDEQDAALAFTCGHPLALALVADVAAQGSRPLQATGTPEVVSALLATLVETVPSALHRAALEACAQVKTTTEPLLADLLEIEDARDLFGWLRELSIIDAGPRGLYPHDLARETLASELRWRHPEQYATIHRRAGAYYQARFYAANPIAQGAVLVDYVYLHRASPILGPFVASTAVGNQDMSSLTVSALRPDEHGLVRDAVARHEGEESAALFDHWYQRLPQCVVLVRGVDAEALGLYVIVPMHEVTFADRAVDPALDAAMRHLERTAPLGTGDDAGHIRFWLALDTYQAVSPVQMFITLQFVRYYLSTPGLAFSMVTYADPDFWAPLSAYADMHRMADADFTVGGRTTGVYGHDWRRVAPMAWLTLLAERETAIAPMDVPAPDAARPAQASQLSDADFAAAVRAALRELGRAGGLRTSPLLDARLITSRVTADADTRTRVDALRAALRDAAATLEQSPRDRRAYRALHHTYLQPAPTQADAADLLRLPMSTYRRHLATGIERITEVLWQREQD